MDSGATLSEFKGYSSRVKSHCRLNLMFSFFNEMLLRKDFVPWAALVGIVPCFTVPGLLVKCPTVKYAHMRTRVIYTKTIYTESRMWRLIGSKTMGIRSTYHDSAHSSAEGKPQIANPCSSVRYRTENCCADRAPLLRFALSQWNITSHHTTSIA